VLSRFSFLACFWFLLFVFAVFTLDFAFIFGENWINCDLKIILLFVWYAPLFFYTGVENDSTIFFVFFKLFKCYCACAFLSPKCRVKSNHSVFLNMLRKVWIWTQYLMLWKYSRIFFLCRPKWKILKSKI
jgi:hypothetical protein